MKRASHDLVEEHGGIMHMLSIMSSVAQRLQNGENVDKKHLQKIVEFLQNFADKCHHGKEEDILFPRLIANQSHTTVVNELLGEHKTGRDYIRGINESINNYAVGNADAFHIAINAEAYVQLLTEHINKENAILFPMADKELSEQQQEEIMEQFEVLERDVIGEGKHEEYHGWLKELGAIYLK